MNGSKKVLSNGPTWFYLYQTSCMIMTQWVINWWYTLWNGYKLKLQLIKRCLTLKIIWYLKILVPFYKLTKWYLDFTATWWRKITKRVGKQRRKGVNSLIILGAWTLWKHRNACVFDGDSPSVSTSMRNLQLEGHLWVLAGARNLQNLELGRLGL